MTIDRDRLRAAMDALYQAQAARDQYVATGVTTQHVVDALQTLRQAGVGMKDVRTPDLSRAAWSGTPDIPPGAEPPNPATPTEGPTNPVLTHSGEQEHLVTELSPAREPSPEERRDAWLNLVQKMEGWLLASEQHALHSADFLDILDRKTGPSERRDQEAQRARAWAARRLVDQVRLWHPPEVPRDDEGGQGTLLELFPADAPSTAGEKSVEEPNAAGCRGECGIPHGPDGECL